MLACQSWTANFESLSWTNTTDSSSNSYCISQQSPTPDIIVNKVPAAVLSFWLIKVLSTTVGETEADYLAVNAGLGAAVTATPLWPLRWWRNCAVVLFAVAVKAVRRVS